MKAAIITVAGTSSRFSESLGQNVLKCIYYEVRATNTLLYKIIDHIGSYDQYIIVGGFKFDELTKYVDEHLMIIRDKIKFVFNPYYREKGSGYSLYLGIRALDSEVDDVAFVEGDLYFNKESFLNVCRATKSVITYSDAPILASKAVAVYIDKNNIPKYIYDTKHNLLEISEPFKAIYNSAQIWRFTDINVLRSVLDTMSEDEINGTNLVIIEKYFLWYKGDIEYTFIKDWYNCNTIDEYRIIVDKC